jgi:16S rRNA C967 or C1407 C5-methylase (RsmB/RsmF family)
MKEVVELIRIEFPEMNYGGVIDPGEEWERLVADPKMFYVDVHLPNVFVFGPEVHFLGKSKLVADGILVLQQKSSCFPGFLACHGRAGLFKAGIDACAAPGNKTSHLLASMGTDGVVWAFEKDSRRVELLRQRMSQLGAYGVTCMHQDFLASEELLTFPAQVILSTFLTLQNAKRLWKNRWPWSIRRVPVREWCCEASRSR